MQEEREYDEEVEGRADAASLASCSYEDDDYEHDDDTDIFTRPIIVGYAFGPKKMSTMGVVMAEASKTKLSTTPIIVSKRTTQVDTTKIDTIVNAAVDDIKETVSRRIGEPLLDDGNDYERSPHQEESWNDCRVDDPGLKKNSNLDNSSFTHLLCHDVSLDRLDNHSQYKCSLDALATANLLSSPPSSGSVLQPQPDDDRVFFSMDRGVVSGSANGTADGPAGLYNIVRFFRSSCSSVVDSISTGTCTASSTTGSQRTASTARHTSSGSSTLAQHPARVSFVPLDMEVPLEEQHGGQMDVILHKLTEDILCLSLLAIEHGELADLSQFKSINQIDQTFQGEIGESELAAIRRIYRLCQFRTNHPNCYLVDDPACVQTLMSRADIASTLKKCLKGVTSTSGIRVRSPKSIVLLAHSPKQNLELFQQKGLSFPIIAKPLIAAGTKASHAMAIILDPESLSRVVPPCLCQEYCNHDALLYKVYVLGDHVSVHKRRSLPNLPAGKSGTGFLEFDSQRPYPRLSDFSFMEDDDDIVDDNIDNDGDEMLSGKRKLPQPPQVVVTSEEVKPIVDALKEAFGLELFGFDVLITSSSRSSSSSLEPSELEMLVVDVNYFPSYKEVPHFPALLARYLTDHGIESRRMTTAQTP